MSGAHGIDEDDALKKIPEENPQVMDVESDLIKHNKEGLSKTTVSGPFTQEFATRNDGTYDTRFNK
jgi:hypothetical protein